MTPPIEVLDDLSDNENLLVSASRRGEVLACSDLAVEVLACSDNPSHHVRAELIRELLLGRRGELDPHGVQLRQARVIGTLDLAHVEAAAGLELVECVVEETVDLSDATLPRLVLNGCLTGAIYGDGLRVEGNLFLEQVCATGTGELGIIRLPGARVGGQLNLVGVQVSNDSGPGVSADRLRVDGSVIFCRARVVGAGDEGAIRLVNARIGGQLTLSGTQVTNRSGSAMHGDGLHVDESIYLDDIRADGSGTQGTIRLSGARIGGQFSGNHAQVSNDSGPAVNADRLDLGASMSLRYMSATGAGEGSAIRLLNARIGGQLTFNGAHLRNDSGPALAADGIQVDGDVYFLEAAIVGVGDLGAVRLIGARLRQFTGAGSRVSNTSGPAIGADDLQIDVSLNLDHTTLESVGERGTVRLIRARVGHEFTFEYTQFSNPSGLFLDLRDASAVSVNLPLGMVCPDQAEGTCQGVPRVDLDGCTFTSLAGASWKQWLHLIQHHTPTYRPSPYQQLNAIERAAGHDDNARRILLAQQRDLGQRVPEALGGWLSRAVHRVWGAMAGYGYRARRTALALSIAIVLAGGLGWWAGHWTTAPGRHAVERTIGSGSPAGTPCSTIEQIGVGIDRALPLAPAGIRTRCDVDSSTTAGQWFTTAIWLVQATIWALATLALAGYTGLIRKPA
jgi:hypothetical protein